jgi:hypothetical protein
MADCGSAVVRRWERIHLATRLAVWLRPRFSLGAAVILQFAAGTLLLLDLAELPAKVRPFLEAFARERKLGEAFSSWWGRTRADGNAVRPAQFRVECGSRFFAVR